MGNNSYLMVSPARREEGADVGEIDAIVVDARGDDARRGGDEQAQDGCGLHFALVGYLFFTG